MCGIFGFSGTCNPDLLTAMDAALSHRGPDSSGTRSLRASPGQTVALGHRRLAIIDLSPTGEQRQISPGKSLTV